jgi:hypothetical protein
MLFDDRPASSLNEIQARVRQFKPQDRTLRLLIIGGLEPLWHKGERDVEEAERVVEGLRELSCGPIRHGRRIRKWAPWRAPERRKESFEWELSSSLSAPEARTLVRFERHCLYPVSRTM